MSQAHIANAFLILLEQADFETVSISDICRTAGVSRQTFYSLFANKENILLFLLNKDCTGTVHTDMDEAQRFAYDCAAYIFTKKELLQVLYRTQRLHLLQTVHAERFYSNPNFLPHLTNARRHYIACYLAGGLNGIIYAYFDHGCLDSPQTLTQVIYQLFTAQYK